METRGRERGCTGEPVRDGILPGLGWAGNSFLGGKFIFGLVATTTACRAVQPHSICTVPREKVNLTSTIA